MAEWLIADVPLFNIHVQLWMLLVRSRADLVSLCLGNTIARLNATSANCARPAGTTLEDLLTLHFRADPGSAVRTSLRT
jgi:hypothetical protein